MVAVLTGDIINSRDVDALIWLQKLKDVLNIYGQTPKNWGIFRGDSFQLLVAPKDAITAAIHIKAVIKQNKNQDVRIAIGIGKETHSANKITESNGTAYINSGEKFESLKKQTLAIKSNNSNLDTTLNLMISLALLTANNWSSTVAEVITTAIENPNKHQKDIAKLLNKSQSSVSEALKRGGYEEIMSLNTYYQKQISNI
tara:strand:- start:25254 stop:25853 length:600 start_codon:yes stop_codon:yes gene_type:complete